MVCRQRKYTTTKASFVVQNEMKGGKEGYMEDAKGRGHLGEVEAKQLAELVAELAQNEEGAVLI